MGKRDPPAPFHMVICCSLVVPVICVCADRCLDVAVQQRSTEPSMIDLSF